MEKAVALPLLHIADPRGAAIKSADLKRVGLVGSKYTMESDSVLKGRLRERYGIDVIVPQGEDAREASRVIYEELVRGKFLESSSTRYRDIIAKLVAEGAQGIILGCTELPLLLKSEDCAVPMFDTTALHTMAAVDLALS
jgi:aspartate racemase